MNINIPLFLNLQSWQDWKSKVKAKAASIAKYRQGTGGGSPPKPLSDIEELCVEILTEEAIVGDKDLPEGGARPSDSNVVQPPPSNSRQQNVQPATTTTLTKTSTRTQPQPSTSHGWEKRGEPCHQPTTSHHRRPGMRHIGPWTMTSKCS